MSGCLCDQRSPGSWLLPNEGNLHLINIELKSIVIFIKDTGLDSPLYSTAPESGLRFNFIGFTVSGSTPIWIVCLDAELALLYCRLYCKLQHSWTLYSLQSLHGIDLYVAYLGIVIGFVVFKKAFLKWTLTVAVACCSPYCQTHQNRRDGWNWSKPK